MLFTFCAFSTLPYCQLNKREARLIYVNWAGESVLCLLVASTVFTLLVIGLLARFLRPAIVWVYTFVAILVIPTSFCLFFYFEEIYKDQFKFLGVYYFVLVLGLLASAIGWALYVFISRVAYFPLLSFLFMSVGSALVGYGFFLYYDSVIFDYRLLGLT